MCFRPQFVLAVALAACSAPAWPQSDGDAPLGDVARNIRKAKVTTKAAEVRVDNDNFSNIMENSEARRMRTLNAPALSLDLGLAPGGTPFSAADVNCSLAFSAHGIRLTDALGPPSAKDPAKNAARDAAKDAEKDKDKEAKAKEADNSPKDVPASELNKIEGPATIIGDSLQLSVYNGTGWQLEEITIGLTILRHPSQATSIPSTGRLVPASSVQIVAKRSDTTILYHFKGSAAPNTRQIFAQPLGISLSADQEWHWAIIEAKGTPPKGVEAKMPETKISDLKPAESKTGAGKSN